VWAFHSYLLDYLVDDLHTFIKVSYSLEEINNIYNEMKWKALNLVVLGLFSIISYSDRYKGGWNRLIYSIIISYLLDQAIDSIFYNISGIRWSDLPTLIFTLIIHFYGKLDLTLKNT
jgi:hypothetical protein